MKHKNAKLWYVVEKEQSYSIYGDGETTSHRFDSEWEAVEYCGDNEIFGVEIKRIIEWQITDGDEC